MNLPTLTSLQSSIAALCTQDGISAETLADILPAELVSWALPQQPAEHADGAAAELDADTNAEAVLLNWLFADPEATEKPLRPRLQAAISRAADTVATERHLASLGEVIWPLADDVESDAHKAGIEVLQNRTRYISMCSTGAAAFLTTVPSHNRHLSMESRHWRDSMRRWLGIERPNPGGLCPGPGCTHMLTAEIARRCCQTGEQNFRHALLCDMVHDTLKDSTRLPGTRREDATQFIACNHEGLRIDITWQPGHMYLPVLNQDGSHMPPAQGHEKHGGLLDVSLVDSSSPANVKIGVRSKKGPAFKSGAAMQHRVTEKYNTYGGKHPSNYTLIPFILEHTGASCAHVQVFIKAAARHEHTLSGGAYAQGTIVQRWRQKISVTLQKVLSVTTERLFLGTRAVAGLPELNVRRHEKVHLLRRPVVLQQQQQQQQLQQQVDAGLGVAGD